jgi:hypothetical protein
MQSQIVEAPPQVRRAIVLLWTSFALATIEALTQQVPADRGDFGFADALFAGILFSINAAAIYYAARGKRWARGILLAFTLLSVVVYLAIPSAFENDPWWATAMGVVGTSMEVVALFWLFTGASAAWFSKNAQAQGAKTK